MQFQIKDFYGIASVLMAIVVLANFWNLFSNWNLMNIPSRISFLAGSILFQILLFVLFFGLWRVTPKVGKIVDDKILDDVLKNIETKNERRENNNGIWKKETAVHRTR